MTQEKIPITAATRAHLIELNLQAAKAQDRLADAFAILYAQAGITAKATALTITDVEPFELVVAIEKKEEPPIAG